MTSLSFDVAPAWLRRLRYRLWVSSVAKTTRRLLKSVRWAAGIGT